jgi:hypothetical protein
LVRAGIPVGVDGIGVNVSVGPGSIWVGVSTGLVGPGEGGGETISPKGTLALTGNSGVEVTLHDDTMIKARTIIIAFKLLGMLVLPKQKNTYKMYLSDKHFNEISITDIISDSSLKTE